MARTSSRGRPERQLEPQTPAWGPRGDLVGIALITLGILLLGGLRAADTGPVVSWAASHLELFLGRLGLLVPFLFFFAGAVCMLRGKAPASADTMGIGLLFVVVVAAMLHLRVPLGEEFAPTAAGTGYLHPPDEYGGLVGAGVVWLLRRLTGPVGCPIVLFMAAVAGIVALSQRGAAEVMRAWKRQVAASVQGAARAGARRPPAPPASRPAEASPPAAAEPSPPAWYPEPESGDNGTPPPRPQPPPASVDPDTPAVPTFMQVPPREVTPPPQRQRPAFGERDPFRPRSGPTPVGGVDPKQLTLPNMPLKAEPADEGILAPDGEYRLPPLRLVEPTPCPPPPDRTPEIIANSERLEATLASFRIEARVVNTEVGPTVTRYELELAPGIRVNKVANLADDISLALSSTGIRIEAPVPGKGVVGIEVPNQTREVVDLHEILAGKEFRSVPGPLPFVVGRDIAGHIKLGELTRMPHMLVAGSTNSGKSVCLNCLIISLLYRLSPRDLRFLMIDPKRVELTLYDGIPHLDRPVVTDPEDAADLLRGAVREMMARYDRLHAEGVRNVTTFNQQVDPSERMPYIVVIVDELAELMMLARAEVEASICRLAQLARATGIHLVVATQRPSVNVVTGSIKANIGTRVAFAVAQQVDSRVILDQVGAERLIGRGDMLYSPIDATKPERIQGAFVDEAQVHALVEHLQAVPSTLRLHYDSIIQPVSADEETVLDGDAPEDMDLDELFWECVQFVRNEGEASTSRLQRNYGIGYNRAGRIVDQMHALGIVGPPRGSKPRELLPGGPSGPSALFSSASSGDVAIDLLDELDPDDEG